MITKKIQVAALLASVLWTGGVSAWTSKFRIPSISASEQSINGHLVTRRVFAGTVACPIAGAWFSQPDTSQAAAPVDAGEAVRLYAANIPGYGPSDVFYPSTWMGTWRARREVVTGNAEPMILEYSVRFLPSIQDNAVVADRGFNQANLEAALRKQDDAVRSYEWKETNPNDLRMVLADGSRKDIKVTKRATETTDDTVFSSEFQRVSQEDARGIPAITARRVLTKWKVSNEKELEGLEIVYDMGFGGDPMSLQTVSTNQPKVLSKSRLLLQRS
jgi:hypothetical protein